MAVCWLYMGEQWVKQSCCYLECNQFVRHKRQSALTAQYAWSNVFLSPNEKIKIEYGSLLGQYTIHNALSAIWRALFQNTIFLNIINYVLKCAFQVLLVGVQSGQNKWSLKIHSNGRYLILDKIPSHIEYILVVYMHWCTHCFNHK